MTTPKLSSEKLLDCSLFKNLTRRRLPHILVAFLVNFFTLSVPIMMSFGDLMERSKSWSLEKYLERAAEYMQEIMVIHLVFMFILGIYFGVITLGYMMKRRSAHFYHALPQKRETLYTTGITSALVCAAVGGLVNLCIVFAEMGVYSLLVPEVLDVFFPLLIKNIVFFLSTYALTVFAGSFSGNGIVQVLMTVVSMIYPLATYFGMILLRQVHSTYLYEAFYLSDTVIQWLSPIAYAGYNYWGEFQILPTLIALLVTAALLLGGMAIYRKRAIENSERPIVFGKLGTVLKFMLMFTVTMYAGLFFYAIGESIFYMVFGFVCGALLSFMLFNTILAKSPKAMFKGMRGLIVFAVAFALYYTVFGFDVFKMDRYVPSAENLSRAEITVSGAGDYADDRFDDPEMLAALSTMLKNQQASDLAGTYIPYRDTTEFYVQTIMYTKLGIPVARYYTVSKFTEGAQEFLRLYADDARMNEQMEKVFDAFEDVIDSGYTVELRVNNTYDEAGQYDLAEFFKLYKKEYGTANYARLSKPVVATVEIHNILASGESYYSLRSFYEDIPYELQELPVFADMTETIAYLDLPAETIDMTYENEEGETVEVPLTAAYLYDIREPVTTSASATYMRADNFARYPRIEISTELGRELGNMLVQYKRYTSLSRTFLAVDTDYVLYLKFGETWEDTDGDAESTNAYYYDEDGLKYVTATEASSYYDERTFVFPEGYVPEEVKALFE